MDTQSIAYNRSVLRLAVPSILANITIPLVGIVDVAILGHIADAAIVAGIAIGTMLFDLLYWNFGFLRVGTSGLTAQAVGRSDANGQVRILSQALTTALLAALGIWLLQWFFLTAVLYCVPCSPEAAAFARHYFFVRIWAAPATLSLMALKGWFIGMQNTVAPMLTDIVVNGVNMVASYALAAWVCGPIGVAYGTLIAQYSGLLTAAVILLWKYRSLFRLRPFNTLREHLPDGRFFRLNANLFVRSLFFLIIYVGYTTIASRYGDSELAVSNIIMKLFMPFSYFIDGFAYAGEALTGKLGALPTEKNSSLHWIRNKEVDRVVRVLFCWAIALGVLFLVIYYLGAGRMMALMTSDMALRHAAEPYYFWLALMPFFSSLAFMWDGVYIGATASRHVRNCMAWAALAFLLFYIALSPYMGIDALYLAYIMHLLARTGYLTVAWFSLPRAIA